MGNQVSENNPSSQPPIQIVLSGYRIHPLVEISHLFVIGKDRAKVILRFLGQGSEYVGYEMSPLRKGLVEH